MTRWFLLYAPLALSAAALAQAPEKLKAGNAAQSKVLSPRHSCELHRVDWRKGVRHAGPMVSLVLAHPEAPCRGAEGEAVPRLAQRQGMTVDDVVGVRLRQASGQEVEALAAVAGARDRQLAVTWDPLLILDFRNKPRRIGVARMHDNRETESRWLDPIDLRERLAFVGRDEDSVVVLHPHAMRGGRTLNQAMNILGDLIVGQLWRHVLGQHPPPELCS